MPLTEPLISELVDFHFCLEHYGTAVRGRDADTGLHVHPFWQLDVFPDGLVQVFTGTVPPLPTTPGETVLIPPMTPHGYAAGSPALQISFKFFLQPRYWLALTSGSRQTKVPSAYIDLIREAAGEGGPGDSPWRSQRLVSLATLCLLEVLESDDAGQEVCAVTPFWGRRIQETLELIEAEPFRAWTVAELAMDCDVCADHFSRCFRELVGTRPERFLLETRLRHAAMRLLEGAVSIKQVAREANYTTVQAFSRAFQNVFGTSPGRYLRTLPKRR